MRFVASLLRARISEVRLERCQFQTKLSRSEKVNDSEFPPVWTSASSAVLDQRRSASSSCAQAVPGPHHAIANKLRINPRILRIDAAG